MEYGINPDDGVSEMERAAMLQNTIFLQGVMACSEDVAIYLPSGTYYFAEGHNTMAPNSDRREFSVIRLTNRLTLIGSGTGENNTTLKPYSQVDDFKQGKDVIPGGLDMFFFNNYAAYNYNSNIENLYLVNTDFFNFIIDSDHTTGLKYNTSGKGFMINIFRDSVWDNIVVKNTDGTGFGIDNPINVEYQIAKRLTAEKASKADRTVADLALVLVSAIQTKNLSILMIVKHIIMQSSASSLSIKIDLVPQIDILPFRLMASRLVMRMQKAICIITAG